MLLSTVDGHVIWRTVTFAGSAETALKGPLLLVADDRIALTAVANEADSPEVERPEVPRMIAIDTATGARSWERTGPWPMAIAGDTVIGLNAKGYDAAASEVGPDAMVAAFDATTGAPRWDLHDRYQGSKVVLAAADVVLVQVIDGRKKKLTVLSAATGKRVTDLGESNRNGCATDGTATIACMDIVDTVSVFHLADRSVTRVPRDAWADFSYCVWHDRIFLSRLPEDATETRYYSVDLAGNVIDPDLPGQPLAISDDYLIVRGGPNEKAISGYPLG
jgi:outer membrane protein assembly factor BamB